MSKKHFLLSQDCPGVVGTQVGIKMCARLAVVKEVLPALKYVKKVSKTLILIKGQDEFFINYYFIIYAAKKGALDIMQMKENI